MSINMLDLEPCGLLMFACLLMSELKGGWEKKEGQMEGIKEWEELIFRSSPTFINL